MYWFFMKSSGDYVTIAARINSYLLEMKIAVKLFEDLPPRADVVQVVDGLQSPKFRRTLIYNREWINSDGNLDQAFADIAAENEKYRRAINSIKYIAEGDASYRDALQKKLVKFPHSLLKRQLKHQLERQTTVQTVTLQLTL
jgi:hypothetical protein